VNGGINESPVLAGVGGVGSRDRVTLRVNSQKRDEGLKAGDVHIGVQVRHNAYVSPVISAVLILGGAGMMIAGGRRRAG